MEKCTGASSDMLEYRKRDHERYEENDHGGIQILLGTLGESVVVHIKCWGSDHLVKCAGIVFIAQ